MKIALLSHLSTSPGTRLTTRLFEAAGHTVEHVRPTSMHLVINHVDEPRSRLSTTPPRLADADVVYTRLGSSAPPISLDVVRHIEGSGTPILNASRGLEVCRDKIRSYQVLARYGIPLPETAVLGADAPLDALLEVLGEPPYIVKLPIGTKGGAVSIVDSRRSLRSVLDMLNGLNERVLVQRFVKEASGTDLRVIVLGGHAVCAVRRRASGDEFRSNIALGGADSAVDIDPEVRRVAERAAVAHELAVAGVDILESHDGPVVAEVNGSPGLQGPYRQYGDAFGAQLVDYLERFARGEG